MELQSFVTQFLTGRTQALSPMPGTKVDRMNRIQIPNLKMERLKPREVQELGVHSDKAGILLPLNPHYLLYPKENDLRLLLSSALGVFF